jgi:cobalt/nickel transport system ATP-binding protein
LSSVDKTAAAPAFRLEGATYRYPGGEVGVREVDLTVRAGERMALVGANGSGKSTLLRVLDGLAFPQEGRVSAFGQELTERALSADAFNAAFRRRVGLVFQDADAQLLSSSVWDEVAFGPLHMGLEEAQVRRRVVETLALFALDGIQDRPPFRLSGGEKRKVALASVLAVNPSVLLLDEPTAGLDPRSQRWVVDMLVRLGEAGKTLVTATHDLDVVEEIADRVVVFGEDNRAVAAGRPQDILADRDLLLSVNLIDPRFHPHTHGGEHHHYHSHV